MTNLHDNTSPVNPDITTDAEEETLNANQQIKESLVGEQED